jgi:hypothetical protein
MLLLFFTANSQSTLVNSSSAPDRSVAHSSEPLYADYKGVKIGMTVDLVHQKLGEPSQKVDEQEFYVISETETVQICYDPAGTVCTISVDYLGEGNGAPDYKSVVGNDIEVRPDGSLWKLVRYPKVGFWVSYNRSAGTPRMTTITIQKLK